METIMKIKYLSFLFVSGLVFLGACTQDPPTKEEAARAYERAIHTTTFNQHYLSGELEKGGINPPARFSPNKLIDLYDCNPAPKQPGNVCNFTIIGSLVFQPSVYGAPGPIKNVKLTASGRFYKEKNGEWILFYLSPKSISAPNEKCTGVSRCIVNYPTPTKQQVLSYFKKNSMSSKYGLRVRRVMGEADYFVPEKILSIKKCQSDIFGITCMVNMSGVLTKVDEDMAHWDPLKGPPKPKISRTNFILGYMYPNEFQHP